MEDKRAVEGFLKPHEKCTKCIRGNIVRNLEKDRRLFALIKYESNFALFIYSYEDDQPLASNLQVEYALPINKEFSVKIERDSDTLQGYGKEFNIRVTAEKGVRLVIEVMSTEEVGDFVMGLKKTIKAYKERASVVGDASFKWLENSAKQILKTESVTSGTPSDPSSYDNPLVDLQKLTLNSNEKTVTQEEEDALEMFNFGSTVLSGNEGIPRTRSERSSFLYSSSTFYASPVNFKSERDTFVRLLLEERESEFIDIRQLRFLICTWNVNGQEPIADLKSWFVTEQEGPADVIAVGFQELDLSAEALMGRDSKREAEWLDKVVKGVKQLKEGRHEKQVQYKMVQYARLVGMLLVVFVKKSLFEHVDDVEMEDVGTGIMGMMGNKGGVAIRFRLFNTSFCIVNSHLAAHLEEVERRNQDYRDIMARLTFSRSSLAITDHDVVFWLGDLNYRIDMAYEDVVNLIDQKNYHDLLEHDQLIRQMTFEKCFHKFKEGMIQFQPTYKYNPGTDDWDSEKERVPAWCDRVLWWTSGNNSVQQMAYESHPYLKLSDHKPVSALFNANVKVVDKKREKLVIEEVVRQIDKHENDCLPQVKLSIKELNFGEIQFLEKKSQTFTIENVGQVAVQYAFIPKLQEKHICKPWLIIDPCAGLVKQHDPKSISITVFVDKDSAGPLTSGKEKIDDILVMHLQGGKDIFIPITATYIPSVFGSSIESLVFLYRPIRDAPVAKLIDLDVCDAAPPESKALELPKELWLLVDHLNKHGLKERNIFRQSALEGELQLIRDHLDTKAHGNLPGNIHSVAEALLVFLEGLPEPVIPFLVYDKCLECCNNFVLCKQMVARLSTSHKNVFNYLIEFLKELLAYSDYNDLEAKVLATIFGPIILRPPLDTELPTHKRALNQIFQKRAKFIHWFLISPD